MAGSIEKRGENSWRLVVSAGFGSDGKRIRHKRTVKAKSRREAEKLLAQFVAEVEAGTYVAPSKMTLAEFARHFMADAENKLAMRTRTNYQQIIQIAAPVLGHMKMEDIKPLHIQEFVRYMEGLPKRSRGEGTLSANTVRLYLRLLRNLFTVAVDWGIIKENPCRRVKGPKKEKPRQTVYDLPDITNLLQALKSEPLQLQVFVWLAIATGARLGELSALAWSDFDFEAATVRIERAAKTYTGEGVKIEQTKTESSIRTVAIPRFVIELLHKYRREWTELRWSLGSLWKAGEYLFVTTRGKLRYPEHNGNRFRRFIRRHGLKELTPHGLRHSSASLLIAADVELKVISGRLGHSTITTTADIYAHLLQSVDKVAAEKLGALLETADRLGAGYR
jgi:integrase